MPDVQYFSHDLKLSPTSSPADTIFPAKLAYKTFGDPKNPAVLLPTCYGGHIDETCVPSLLLLLSFVCQRSLH